MRRRSRSRRPTTWMVPRWRPVTGLLLSVSKTFSLELPASSDEEVVDDCEWVIVVVEQYIFLVTSFASSSSLDAIESECFWWNYCCRRARGAWRIGAELAGSGAPWQKFTRPLAWSGGYQTWKLCTIRKPMGCVTFFLETKKLAPDLCIWQNMGLLITIPLKQSPPLFSFIDSWSSPVSAYNSWARPGWRGPGTVIECLTKLIPKISGGISSKLIPGRSWDSHAARWTFCSATNGRGCWDKNGLNWRRISESGEEVAEHCLPAGAGGDQGDDSGEIP